MADKKTSRLKGVRSEFKKVNWPTKQETIQYTVVVLIIATIIALLAYGLDVVFGWLISLFS